MNYLKHQKRFKLLILLSIVCASYSTSFGQFHQIIIGGGVAPLHKSGQSDFAILKMPYDTYIMYQRGNLGLRIDYNWNSTYQKENFSFTTNAYEVSLTYSLKEQFRLTKLNPYVRLGGSKWKTVFTTEGYPGITDYELKIEEDQGYGLVGALGITYPYKSFAFGIEAQYAKNGTSQFIAGGFDPQPLLSDQFRLMFTAQYRLPITISSSKGFAITCPKF